MVVGSMDLDISSSSVAASGLVQSPVAQNTPSTISDSTPKIFSGLKQRIMSYLYRKAIASLSTNPKALTHFYLTFSYFSNLVFWRCGFLDDEHILIKFGSLQSISNRSASADTSNFTSFFVIYSLATTQVIGVYENGSQEMLQYFMAWDALRGQHISSTLSNPVSHVSNSKYAHDALSKTMFAIRKARNGGYTQSIRRVLSNLPFNPQSFSESPYFDLDLFSFGTSLSRLYSLTSPQNR